MLVRRRVAAEARERRHPPSEHRAQAAHSRVVAAGLFAQHRVAIARGAGRARRVPRPSRARAGTHRSRSPPGTRAPRRASSSLIASPRSSWRTIGTTSEVSHRRSQCTRRIRQMSGGSEVRGWRSMAFVARRERLQEPAGETIFWGPLEAALSASARRYRCFRFTACLSTLLRADSGQGELAPMNRWEARPPTPTRKAEMYAASTPTPLAAPPDSTRARPSARLRLRTLVTLGVLAVATALLGRTFGLHDVCASSHPRSRCS